MTAPGGGDVGGGQAGGVTVAGSGTAAAPPDVVRLLLAAEASDADVGAALERAAAGLAALRRALLDGGVAEADLRTTDSALYTDDSRHTARLGLQASVRDVTAAGRLLTAALAAAGRTARSNGLVFGHDDPTALLVAARAAAYADARARAEQLAALAGRRLGPVRWVVESEPGGGGPRPMGGRMYALAAAEVAVDAGTQEVRAVVTVCFDWAD